MSFKESIIAAAEFLAPTWAAKRYELRRQNDLRDTLHKHQKRLIERHFDGAKTDDRNRADMWLRSKMSPDTFLDSDLDTLRTYADELYRNFSYIRGAVDHRTDNVVGSGLKPKAAIRPVEGVITEEQAKRWNKQLDDLYNRWAAKAGRSGRQTVGEVQRVSYRTWRKVGDSLVVFSDTAQPGKPIPLQLNVVDPERLSTPSDEAGNHRIRHGIERNEDGTIVAYHIQDAHPFESVNWKQTWTAYPPERVCHLYEELWPDQTRGLPWCFPVITDCRDFKDYKEAVLIAAQIGACQGYILRTSNPALLALAQQDSAGLQRIAPGNIPIVDESTDMKAFTPSQPTTTFPQFTDSNLGAIAAGLNYPKAWITRDRSRATFSAGKLEEIEGGIPLRADFHTVKDRLIVATWEIFVREAVAFGQMVGVDIPPQLFNEMPWIFLAMTCAPVGRPFIDPGKEIPAAIAAIEHNIIPLSSFHAKLGEDSDDTLEICSVVKKKQEVLDIVPPVSSGTPIPDAPDQPAVTADLGAADDE